MSGAELMEFALYAIICGLGGPIMITIGLGLSFLAWTKLNNLD